MSESPYHMTLSLNLLNHLGINLYSNVPAVLSETVANAWDADAESVDIVIDKRGGTIVITDNGHGMDLADINGKFLTIGYRRRDPGNQGAVSPTLLRPVMGRKGIGKLSLFSIARDIRIYTVKNGEKRGFKMLLSEIEAKISRKESDYQPSILSDFPTDLLKGTRIVLAELKKSQHQTETALRKRLARRFSILGEKSRFALKINSKPVSIVDRGYFSKLQFLWHYGPIDALPISNPDKLGSCEERANEIALPTEGDDPAQKFQVTGWIGTVRESGDLKDEEDNLNKIVVMVRGKMAQEDILEDFNEGGMYSKYLIGEIHADFLDLNEQDDIATSSRQKIMEDDPRYVALREFIQQELKHVQNKWTDLRNKRGTEEAMQIPAIKAWFNDLGGDGKRKASSLFGKINQLTIESPQDKKQLFKYGVLAFEHLRYKENLDALEKIKPEDIAIIGEIFADLDDIEASLYHQILSGRIEVIEALESKVDSNELESVIRDYVYSHLWLLDPAWERATDTEYVESGLRKEFIDFAESEISEDERKARFDIKYSTTSKTHVIIELKRPERKMELGDLLKQGEKYRDGLTALLVNRRRENEPIEVVFLIGVPLKNWNNPKRRDEDEDVFRRKGMRVLLYKELLDNTRHIYSEYLKKRKETGRIQRLLNSIDEAVIT